MRRTAGLVVGLALVVGLVAACSAASDSSGTSSEVKAPALSAGDVSGGEQAADGGVAGVDAMADVDRQVVTTGSVVLVVGDPAAAATRAGEIVELAGGRVDERTELAASDEREASARLVLRIPAGALTAALAELKALGEVDQVQLTSTDVTDAAQDLDARISALEVSVGRLETLMASSTTSADLIDLESALSSRQGDLESKRAERSSLAGQVALATVTLDLVPEATIAAGGPNGFWSAIGTGWTSLLTTLRGVLIAVGVLIPWVAFTGSIGAACLVVIRWVRRRRTSGSAPVAVSAPTT